MTLDRFWRCWYGCWAWHPSLDPICPRTNIPRDFK